MGCKQVSIQSYSIQNMFSYYEYNEIYSIYLNIMKLYINNKYVFKKSTIFKLSV